MSNGGLFAAQGSSVCNGTSLTRKVATLSQARVIQLAVVTGIPVLLLPGFDLVEQRDRLLKQDPAVFERTLVDVNHFIEFRINGILQLANDGAVVNTRGDFMNRDPVLILFVFQSPVDR